MNLHLADYKVLTTLINGKVCVINENNLYRLYPVSKLCSIADGFDPDKYAILISNKYPKMIIYASKEQITTAKVNRAYKKQFYPVPYHIGDKIHIYSREGIYELIAIDDDLLTITCGTWRYTTMPNHVIRSSDFKCLAGGRYNKSWY
jgi:hypothetical protein